MSFSFPVIKFCPSCGSKKLSGEHWHPGSGKVPVEGYACACPEAEEIGGLSTECGECHTHFTVSGVETFVIEDA